MVALLSIKPYHPARAHVLRGMPVAAVLVGVVVFSDAPYERALVVFVAGICSFLTAVPRRYLQDSVNTGIIMT